MAHYRLREDAPDVTSATRGSVLAGRYRLEERVQSSPDGSLWRAVDSTLDRHVSVRLMRPAHPFAADVADAARRAALIDDQRLVRVLDVGADGDTVFVVSQYVEGDSLASLVERSPLAPMVVRRIIGEVAQGLDGAAARGLHHLRLTPRSVIVIRDGSVKIAGTAVEAAAAGLEPHHAATASRVDTVAMVGLLYDGLTGRWPLGDAGYPAAPRGEGGGPVPPADLVPGIPNDLDTLCVVTLGGADHGPRTPGELVTELSPWSTAAEAPLRAASRRMPSDAPAGSPGPDPRLRLRTTPAGRRHTGSFSRPQQSASRDAAAGTGGPAIAATGPASTAPAASGSWSLRPGRPAPTSNAAAAPPEVATGPGGPPRPGRSAPAERENARRQSLPPASARPIESSRPARSARSAPPNGPLLPWGPDWVGDDEPPSALESTGPLRIVIPPEAPPREQSRMVISIITGVLALGLIVAGFSLRGFGGGEATATPSETGVPLPTGAGAATAPFSSAAPAPSSVAASATPAPTPTPTPTPSVSNKPVPVEIAGIRAIDPQGDGDENSSDSKRAVDGNTSSTWDSQTYNSSRFGGLKKGVGLSLKLKQKAVVSAATIEIKGSGGSVELRTSDGPDYAGSTKVAQGTFKSGKVTLTPDGAKASKYVILWFTELPSQGGKHKIEVSEVRLT